MPFVDANDFAENGIEIAFQGFSGNPESAEYQVRFAARALWDNSGFQGNILSRPGSNLSAQSPIKVLISDNKMSSPISVGTIEIEGVTFNAGERFVWMDPSYQSSFFNSKAEVIDQELWRMLGHEMTHVVLGTSDTTDNDLNGSPSQRDYRGATVTYENLYLTSLDGTQKT